MCEMSNNTKEEMVGGFKKWEVEGFLDTLIRAREILKDPKKVSAVKAIANDRNAAVDEVIAQLHLEKTVKEKLRKL